MRIGIDGLGRITLSVGIDSTGVIGNSAAASGRHLAYHYDEEEGTLRRS